MRSTVPGFLSVLLVSVLVARPARAQNEEPSDSAQSLPPDSVESLPQPTHRHHRRTGNSSLREVGEPSARRGLWVGLGVGAGQESYRFSGAGYSYSPYLTRPTLSLRVGGTVGDQLRIGGELFGWFNEEGGVLESVTSLDLIGQFYPFAGAGLYLKGGAGFARYGVDFANYGGPSQGDLGWSGTIGAGYEFRVGRKVWLAPNFDLNYAYFDGRTYAAYHERILSVGVAVVVQDR